MIPRVPVTASDVPFWIRTAANAINGLLRLVDAPVPGPFADDAAAEAGKVPVGSIYRKNDGTIGWRQA